MGAHCISLACRGPSFFTSLFSGHIIDHECCLISGVLLRNQHIYPSTMSRSVSVSCSARIKCISTNSVNFSRFFKLRQTYAQLGRLRRVSTACEVWKLTDGDDVSYWVVRNDICMVWL